MFNRFYLHWNQRYSKSWKVRLRIYLLLLFSLNLSLVVSRHWNDETRACIVSHFSLCGFVLLVRLCCSLLKQLLILKWFKWFNLIYECSRQHCACRLLFLLQPAVTRINLHAYYIINQSAELKWKSLENTAPCWSKLVQCHQAVGTPPSNYEQTSGAALQLHPLWLRDKSNHPCVKHGIWKHLLGISMRFKSEKVNEDRKLAPPLSWLRPLRVRLCSLRHVPSVKATPGAVGVGGGYVVLMQWFSTFSWHWTPCVCFNPPWGPTLPPVSTKASGGNCLFNCISAWWLWKYVISMLYMFYYVTTSLLLLFPVFMCLFLTSTLLILLFSHFTVKYLL